MPQINQMHKMTEKTDLTRPIRVLQVVTTMNRGGLETMLMNYYRHIDRTQIQFDFLIHRNEKSDYEEEILGLGGRIYRVHPLRPFDPSYKKALNNFFREHTEFSIVHVHQDCMSSIALNEAAKCNVPVRIAHCHNSNQDKNWKYPIKLFYKRKIARYATSLFSCSQESGRWMFETDAFRLLNNAVDIEKFKYSSSDRIQIRKEFNISDKCFLCGHVGRFDKVKNHEFLIRIFSEFVKTNEQAKLMLVGSGAEFEKIKKLVNSLYLQDKIIFTGLRSDVSSLMSAMDLFIMPSLYEGTPMVLVEAQASGLPCLISDSIPKDCDLTGLVTRCSLTDEPDHWINQLKTNQVVERKNSYLQVQEKGFDIQKNASWLQNFYLDSL